MPHKSLFPAGAPDQKTINSGGGSAAQGRAGQGEHGVCNQSMGCLVWANKVETICEVWIEQEPLQANSLCGSGNAWRKRGLWAYKVETRLCDVYQAKSGSDKEPCRRNSVDQTQEFRMPRDRLLHIGGNVSRKGF